MSEDIAPDEPTPSVRLWIARVLRLPIRRPSEARPAFLAPLHEQLLNQVAGRHLGLRRAILERAELYWKTGQEDAHRGQRRAEFRDVARSAAELISQEQSSEYSAKKARFDQARTTHASVLDSARKRFEACDQHLGRLERYYQTNPGARSLLLAAAYLFVAIALIVADIPLALRITQIGFDFELAWSGVEATIPRLFEQPWVVFTQNWEVFLLSIGLALSAVYVKVFCDRYLQADIPTRDDEVPPSSRLKTTWFPRVVLGFTVLTIVTIGFFRYMTKYIDPEQAAEVPAFLRGPEIHATVEIAAFICISLLFPVIGGICLSMGLHQFHSWRALLTARWSRWRARRQFEAASRELERLTEDATDWDGMLGWVKASRFLDATCALLEASYRHGYERGWMDRLPPSWDVMATAAIARSLGLAHAVCERLNPLYEIDGPPPDGSGRRELVIGTTREGP